MKKSVRMLLIQGVAAIAMLATAALAGAATTKTADQSLSTLLSGNSPYIVGNFAALSKNAQPGIRTTLAAGQSPYAIVLGCSDSRVAPEIIFDKGLGEVFPIRVAGNIIADHEIGSIEYAVEHLCAPLIVIMGHSKCGAVTTAVDVKLGAIKLSDLSPAIQSLVNTLMPAVDNAYAVVKQLLGETAEDYRARLIQASIEENVRYTAADLVAQSLIVREAVETGMPLDACPLQKGAKARLVGAIYDVTTGKVKLLPLAP